MANTRISDLTASASNLASTDLAPVVQTVGVGPVKMTGAQIAAGLLSATTPIGSGPILSRGGSATLQLGAADAATTAVAQTLQVQSNTGAADGPDFTIKGSNSGAANTGGNINFQLADAGAYSTQLYLRTDKVAVFGSSTSSAFNVQVRQSSSGITVSNNGGAATARMTGDRTGSGGGARIHVGSNAEIGWNDATTLTTSAFDTILTRGGAAATLQLGAADAAAPVAQTFKVQGVVAGTTNTAGANFTIQGSQGTGTGAGGSIIFQVAPAGSSGTAQNAYSTALTIASNKEATFVENINIGAAKKIVWFPGGTEASVSSTEYIFTCRTGGVFNFGSTNTRFTIATNSFLNWGGSGDADGDLRLYRDDANTLALRNGTNAQTFNVYGSYTSTTNYQRVVVKTLREVSSALSGATYVSTIQIPAYALLVGVTTRVNTAITGATSYSVGDGTTANLWGNNIGIALNTQSQTSDFTAVGAVGAAAAARSVTLTANGGNFTAGVVEICLHYLTTEAD